MSAANPKLEPPDRPGASGHRFGPELACSECGVRWDVHQRTPLPCETDADTGEVASAFLRRPAAPSNEATDESPVTLDVETKDGDPAVGRTSSNSSTKPDLE